MRWLQGRASSTHDGFAIAFAAAECLLSSGALTLFATHMERMRDLGALYAGSRHCHLRTVSVHDRLQFLHELTEVRLLPKQRPRFGARCLLTHDLPTNRDHPSRTATTESRLPAAAVCHPLCCTVPASSWTSLNANRLREVHVSSGLYSDAWLLRPPVAGMRRRRRRRRQRVLTVAAPSECGAVGRCRRQRNTRLVAQAARCGASPGNA